MLDQILLAPYYITLKIRHALYDSGIRKVHSAEIPTISVGNVTVGGTGKTPHTEMLIRLLAEHPHWSACSLAVLSRGYRRKSRGFQQVVSGTGTPENGLKHTLAEFFGDEPLQIKKKFPGVTVAVDKNRVEGCDFLRHPEKLSASKKGRKCLHKDFPAADIVVLDDAFQYRSLKPSVSIVLVSHDRPVHSDHLLPAGRLRDLPGRLSKADRAYAISAQLSRTAPSSSADAWNPAPPSACTSMRTVAKPSSSTKGMPPCTNPCPRKERNC